MGFYLDSPIGQMLKLSFGKKWTDQAVCYILNKEHRHLLGTVMRKVPQPKKKKGSQPEQQYEIAWEFTALGESAVGSSHLIGGGIVGCQVESK